jgi:hypothetical protein
VTVLDLRPVPPPPAPRRPPERERVTRVLPPVQVSRALPSATAFPRRVLKHPRFRPYNRLIALVLVVNLLALVHGLGGGGWWSSDRRALDALSATVLANFALAILIRQQYVVNLLFWLATRAPTSWPLTLRWSLGKVYHFGGLHVGGAISGTLWFVALAATIIRAAVGSPGTVSPATVVVTCQLVAVLLVIVTTAAPARRARAHDTFERIHRLGGWTALALFWTQTILSVADQRPPTLVTAVVTSPRIWVLAVITASVALPWLRLKKVDVAVERPSNHVALARFDYGETPFAGSSNVISRNPLWEWHAFANIPVPGKSGFRMAISRAGDWSGSFIDSPPKQVWVKGITTAGVANIEVLFKKVVYVATGSGIGPVLPHLLAGKVAAHLVWATRDPRGTYGEALVDEILAAEPESIIWDTKVHGKPDMVRLAYRAYREFGAEAVICISNKQLTWEVVHGLERRGIPAFGAIWDS